MDGKTYHCTAPRYGCYARTYLGGKPDLIIETDVAHGGSIVYYASLLELIGGEGLVLGIYIDIRKHKRELI